MTKGPEHVQEGSAALAGLLMVVLQVALAMGLVQLLADSGRLVTAALLP